MTNSSFPPHGAGRWFGKAMMALASGAMLLALNSPGLAAERQVLRGHVPEVVARLNLEPVGRLAAKNRLRLVWQTIAGPMTNTALLVLPSNAAAFYRIQEQ